MLQNFHLLIIFHILGHKVLHFDLRYFINKYKLRCDRRLGKLLAPCLLLLFFGKTECSLCVCTTQALRGAQSETQLLKYLMLG